MPKEDKQVSAFDLPEWWEEDWQGMPEFIQEDKTAFKSIYVHFDKREDMEAFSELVKQPIYETTQSIWYPKAKIGKTAGKAYVTRGYDKKKLNNPRYPVYIISKGRWRTRHTAKALEEIGVPYHIVIEPQEYDQYSSVIDEGKILTLPFSNLGQGSIPARNWVWEHAKDTGAARHWILDDNITGFFRLNRNLKIKVKTGAIFRAAEDFVDRYENVAISGFHYFMFAKRKDKLPPFYLNRRIYSCILIDNNLECRWRGRYNEDTDLSIRVLKSGYCTVLFLAFLAFKVTTMTMTGGNTDELYQGEGRLKMAQSLVRQHPDVATVSWKFNRWQHHVDYSSFKKNKLIKKEGIATLKGINNYGMELEITEK